MEIAVIVKSRNCGENRQNWRRMLHLLGNNQRFRFPLVFFRGTSYVTTEG